MLDLIPRLFFAVVPVVEEAVTTRDGWRPWLQRRRQGRELADHGDDHKGGSSGVSTSASHLELTCAHVEVHFLIFAVVVLTAIL